MVEWTEKYRPQKLDDIIGNHKPREDLKKWANSWLNGIPKKKAAVLMGDPGIGKTTAALALANDMGWQVIEMNASDSRNAEAIMSIAGKGAYGETFTDDGEFMTAREGKRKLIILDEADNIFGREDFGGIRAIGQTILGTKQPIILIVNDWYALKKRSSIIQNNALTIKFGKPSKNDIVQLLRTIAGKEGVAVDDAVLIKLADRSGGDVRSALKDLQSIAEGRQRVEMKNMSSLGNRDTSLTVFKSMEILFQTSNCKRSRDSTSSLDENPESLILWVDHNIPAVYKDPKDLHAAYEALSRADIFLGRVKRRQNFSLWSYAGDMMTCGVSLAKSREYHGHINYNFPLYLMKMSRSKGQRGIRKELGTKLAKNAHTSSKRALQDILPYFKYLYNQDMEFRIAITRRLNLSEDEVGYLLGAKPDTHHVKHVFDAMRKVYAVSKSNEPKPDEDDEEEPEPKAKRKSSQKEEEPEEEEQPEEEKKDERQQRNLFDF